MTYNAYLRKTKYDRDKTKKMNNFSFINKNYCCCNQTVIAGDSITEMFNMELFDSYIKKGGRLVYNRGISGDTSNMLLERFDDNVLSIKPANLVLLIGTNDLSLINNVNYIFGNIKEIADKAQAFDQNMNILIQSVYPVDYKNKRKNKNIILLNNMLRSMCAQKGIVYLDIHSLLLDDKGGFRAEYTYDGLHPNAQGFEIAAKQIIPFLV